MNFFGGIKEVNFKSNWNNWFDMKWVGPEYWANRMQDWIIENGKVVCVVSGENRNLNLLTIQKGGNTDDFQQEVEINVLSSEIKGNAEAFVGFKIGVIPI